VGNFTTFDLVAWRADRASRIKAKLEAGQDATRDDIEWLYEMTGAVKYRESANRMCDQLIDALTLRRITEQLLDDGYPFV
jgi:hypothetical protein